MMDGDWFAPAAAIANTSMRPRRDASPSPATPETICILVRSRVF